MLFDRFARHLRAMVFPAVAFGLCWIAPTSGAIAQAIAAVVNGEPITTTDINEQMTFLRIIHKPASRSDALEELVADRLKLHEAAKYGIEPSDADLTQTLNRVAAHAKLAPQALANALQGAKANVDIIRAHLRAIAAWNNYVRARNKSLNVSEAEVTAALAKNANGTANVADYTLQEIVFVVPIGASPAVTEQRQREAQALRSRFQDCAGGLALARALPDVAIKPSFRRDSKGLSETVRKALDQTPNGHLTTPERTATGLQMIAVCGKDDNVNRTTIRDSVQADLINDRLVSIGEEMYKQIRATAVVEKH